MLVAAGRHHLKGQGELLVQSGSLLWRSTIYVKTAIEFDRLKSGIWTRIEARNMTAKIEQLQSIKWRSPSYMHFQLNQNASRAKEERLDSVSKHEREHQEAEKHYFQQMFRDLLLRCRNISHNEA